MMARVVGSTAGFTYIAALMMVVVMGIMLGAVGQSMKSVMQREREKELIFRGLQIRDALERWTKKGTMNLQELKQLQEYGPNKEPLLRRNPFALIDPVTGKEWKILKDPNFGIYGVASTSNDVPLKKGNFPEVVKNFEGKEKYSDWEFTFKRQVQMPKGSRPQGQIQLSLPLYTPEDP
jgi:type II secretory pathway pseudopilin PulG